MIGVGKHGPQCWKGAARGSDLFFAARWTVDSVARINRWNAFSTHAARRPFSNSEPQQWPQNPNPRRPARKPGLPQKKSASAKAPKFVYSWGAGKADGNGSMKPLLGGKGANLAEMSRIGLPVPAGFTITTEVCTYYYANRRTYPAALQAQIADGHREDRGDHGIQVRRRRRASRSLSPSARAPATRCPGMMDTILNLGLNDQTVLSLVAATKNERFAWDCYRRFIQMYGDVVLGVQKAPGRGPRAVRGRHRGAEARALPRPPPRGHEALGRRPEGAHRPLQGAGQGAHRA